MSLTKKQIQNKLYYEKNKENRKTKYILLKDDIKKKNDEKKEERRLKYEKKNPDAKKYIKHILPILNPIKNEEKKNDDIDQTKVIINIINNRKKQNEISEKTIEYYINIVQKLKLDMNLENDNQFTNCEFIINYLENKYNLHTIRNKLSALKWYLKNKSNLEINILNESINKYTLHIQDLNDKYILEKKEKNKIDYDELKNVIDKMEKEASEKEYLIAYLYFNMPRRNDNRTLIYIEDENNMLNFEKGNFYLKNGINSKIIYETFKNAKNIKNEKKIFDINIKLSNLINNYIENKNIKNGQYLFPEFVNHTSSMTKYLQKIFFKYTNQKISSTDLRHIIASYENDQNKIETSIKMSHSALLHLMYKR